MKKIIISVIAILIIASGITCFILNTKDKKLDDSHDISTINEKVNIKDNELSDEKSKIEKDETVEQLNDNTSESKEQKENIEKQPQGKNKEKKSDNGNKSNNTKQNTTVVEEQKPEVKKNDWEELGISEYDYYHKPMWSWQRIDYSIDEYNTEQKTKEACLSKGEEYFKQGIGYSCTSVNSYAGTYLGEMLKTF